MQKISTRALLGSGAACLLAACSSIPTTTSSAGKTFEIAYMSDVHFHDVYAKFEDGSFTGLPSANGQNATIRTMKAQLTSTRLFNENAFAFQAALDDAVARGLKIVVIPGDFSDDGQPVHLRGVRKLMERYGQEHGLRFFVTVGNHDPERPLAIAAGKRDYLGDNGKEQPIFSKNGVPACTGYDTPWAERNGTICTQEVVHGGYQEVFEFMGQFGLMPQADYVYWETPYSSYKGQDGYSLSKAKDEAALSRRRFEMCKQGTGGAYKQANYTDCVMEPDSSYLVEPTPGLWLLAIDANVYIPDKLGAANPREQYSASSNNGYNRMVTHKQNVLAWVKDVAERARREGKTLSVFSHFPTLPFYRNGTSEIATVFGAGGLDLKREPTPATSATVAATGIGMHFGGHMHANDTAVFNKDGNFLVNVQVPSLAAYVPAYKQVSYRDGGKVDIRTIEVKDVPRFNELFEHYRVEHRYLSEKGSAGLWDKGILSARNYSEFASWHIAELTRLRFMQQNWPCDMREQVSRLNGADMLTTALLDTEVTEGQLQQAGKDSSKLLACTAGEKTATSPAAPFGRYDADWHVARTRAAALAAANGLSMEQLAKIRGIDLAIDFHRILNAGELAFADVKPRASFYKTLAQALAGQKGSIRMSSIDAKKPSSENPAGRLFQVRFKPLLQALGKEANSSTPNRDFVVDLTQKTVTGVGGERIDVR
jgi:3',5'-cyclic AMP phosphodiesterase CpdA